MAQVSFGTTLRKERERQGYDLLAVARRLRIRPDVLRAIESSDFEAMPPRGYARNMVNAYARFLGLNPTEVTRLYLDEAYARQVQHARASSQSGAFDPATPSPSRAAAPPSRPEGASDRHFVEQEKAGRTLFVEERGGRYRRPDTDRLYPEERTHRTTRSAFPPTQYTNYYAGPKSPLDLLSKLPIILAGVVALVLVGTLVFFLFIKKDNSGEDIPSVPVTSVPEEGQDAQQEAAAPTKTAFRYEVAEGEDAWVEVYEGETVLEAAVVSGPKTNKFNVTTEIRLSTPRPDAVKVFVDDVEVALADPEGTGTWSITVSFAEELAKWLIAHPQNQTPASDAADAGTGGDGQDAAGGTGDGTAEEQP
ncbi:MAG: helix-turn-helix domain-containing protein [Eggerthellaceae bacterium]|nr:helix-turn-helix domain-containing protein [Eggerthellaceae bacterium]